VFFGEWKASLLIAREREACTTLDFAPHHFEFLKCLSTPISNLSWQIRRKTGARCSHYFRLHRQECLCHIQGQECSLLFFNFWISFAFFGVPVTCHRFLRSSDRWQGSTSGRAVVCSRKRSRLANRRSRSETRSYLRPQIYSSLFPFSFCLLRCYYSTLPRLLPSSPSFRVFSVFRG